MFVHLHIKFLIDFPLDKDIVFMVIIITKIRGFFPHSIMYIYTCAKIINLTVQNFSFYLKGTKTYTHRESQTQGEILHQMIHSSIACNNQGWVKSK